MIATNFKTSAPLLVITSDLLKSPPGERYCSIWETLFYKYKKSYIRTLICRNKKVFKFNTFTWYIVTIVVTDNYFKAVYGTLDEKKKESLIKFVQKYIFSRNKLKSTFTLIF